MIKTKHKAEFGDFQTPIYLARQICALVASKGIKPASIIEPTCGVGNFLIAALEQFPRVERVFGLDIEANHLDALKAKLKHLHSEEKVELVQGNFFDTNWLQILKPFAEPILVIGNPPWITNAELGALKSANLPKKVNFEGLSGLDALTGKSNFDISEWMLLRITDLLNHRKATLAMLCKTAVARKILSYAWKKSFNLHRAQIFGIDAATNFRASVNACLLVCDFSPGSRKRDASVYGSLKDKNASQVIGFRDGQLLADLLACQRWQHLQGDSVYQWRSGIKHDCSRVMEFRQENGLYRNGRGELVDLEEDYLYPMLKSSDLANRLAGTPIRWMLVTQKAMGAETEEIRAHAPKTWQYLQKHAAVLDQRRSSIYRNRPRFSVFGIGDYSFAPWKVGTSGFYKKLEFSVVGTFCSKPIVLDDTSYFVPCQTKEEAEHLVSLLNSNIAKEFFSAFIFWDMKRPVTIDVLRRLDLLALARELGVETIFRRSVSEWAKLGGQAQMRLFD